MLRVLTYHRVLDPGDAADANPSLISATPIAFDRQMQHLAAQYDVVSADDVHAAVRSGGCLPQRAVLLTFDDAYRDFDEVAWPILRQYRLPVTIFVPTAFPDRPGREFWWDRLYRFLQATSRDSLHVRGLGPLPLQTPAFRAAALRTLQQWLKTVPHANLQQEVDAICASLGEPPERPPRPADVLGWNELRRLAAAGVTVAAHTRTHPALTRMSPEAACQEIRGSRDDLRRELGSVPPIFSYPFGLHDDAVAAIVRAEGFDLAVTCMDGQNRPGSTDPFRLRRTNITRRSSPFVFRLRLLRPVSYLDRLRHHAHAHD